MRASYAVILLLGILGLAQPAKAQDETPRFEAYAGYDYTRDNAVNDISFNPPSQSVNGNGGSGQFEFNATRSLGVVGDLAGYAVARNGYATTHLCCRAKFRSTRNAESRIGSKQISG